MKKKIRAVANVPLLLALAALPLAAQEGQKKRVQINVINVCTPSEAEVKEMQAALARIPAKPRFSADFEIARGRSSVDSSVSRWVRVRREFGADSPFTSAQYTLSVNAEDHSVPETLALRLRPPQALVHSAPP